MASGFQPDESSRSLSSSKKVTDSLKRLKTARSHNRRIFNDFNFSYDGSGRRIVRTPRRSPSRFRRTTTIALQDEEQGRFYLEMCRDFKA